MPHRMNEGLCGRRVFFHVGREGARAFGSPSLSGIFSRGWESIYMHTTTEVGDN